jgi:DNA-binding NarL/FixJ family response regulator
MMGKVKALETETGLNPLASRLPLSSRQHDVLLGLQAGQQEKQIAESLGLSQHTVHTHIKAIYERLGVHSYRELMGRSLQGTLHVRVRPGSRNGATLIARHPRKHQQHKRRCP